MIGNDQIVRVEHTLHAIQGFEPFPLARPAHNDTALELVEIEDVRGLAHQEPGKVRGIDGVRNLLLLEKVEIRGHLSAREPVARLADGHVAQHTRRKSAASVFGLDLH